MQREARTTDDSIKRTHDANIICQTSACASIVSCDHEMINVAFLPILWRSDGVKDTIFEHKANLVYRETCSELLQPIHEYYQSGIKKQY